LAGYHDDDGAAVKLRFARRLGGNIAELVATAFVVLLVRFVSVRTTGCRGVLWRGGVSGSQTHDFQSFHFEEDEKLLSKRSPASSKDFEPEPGSTPVGQLWRQETAWTVPAAEEPAALFF
jgi:hypothetical protein